jgi:hypothetical protein
MKLGKNFRAALFPSLHHRKEGWLRHQKNFAKPAKRKRDCAQPKEKPTQPEWFSFCSCRDTTPTSRTADASRYFFDRSATPPRGYARRGISLANLFTASMIAPISQRDIVGDL